MKKTQILLFFTLFFCSFSFGQSQAANWYFGDGAGINFDANNNVTALTDGRLFTDEGCTSISDDSGNLLFYTDGSTVFDKTHNRMPNGNPQNFSGLNGNSSSTQSAIIIPKPGDPNIYYIFTVDTDFGGTTYEGFQYSEVDITLNGGLGNVTTNKNIQLLNSSSEKLSAVVKDCQTENIWVVTFASNIAGQYDSIYAYEVSNTGVNTIPVISRLPISISEWRGYLKFSPNGKKLACANIDSGFFLADFNLATGVATFDQTININHRPNNTLQSPYGLEFSPNNNYLYVSSYFNGAGANNVGNQVDALLQYDINATNIPASETVIDNGRNYRSSLQLGPDGKIYRTMSETYSQGSGSLSVINSPNTQGTACNYRRSVINLNGRLSRQGFPPFIASFFSEKIDIIPTDMTNTSILPLCDGENYTLKADNIPGASYAWTKNGTPLSETTHQLFIDESATYEVTINLNTGDCEIKKGKAIVTFYDVPTVTPPNNIIKCDNNNDDKFDFDLTTQTNDILNGQDPAVFEVKYYRNIMDANDDRAEIIGNYQNETNPQTIHARVQNKNNTNCYTLTKFDITVFDTPIFNPINDISSCDDLTDSDDTNGKTTTDLSVLKNSILGNQNSANFDITFHLTPEDANTNMNPQNESFYNLTPFSLPLFVRIENKLNTDCFTTGSFQLTINPVPIANDVIIKQCDEDGVPDGITQYNLNQAYNDITNSSSTSTIAFYATLPNANSENFPLNGNNYTNTTSNEIIYVVVTNPSTNCKKISELNLQISSTAINDYNPAPVCDELDSLDGKNTFNLNSFSATILAGLPSGVSLNYYETFQDAALEMSPLPVMYENTTPYNQTIYGRAENGNDCFGINKIVLTVNPRPKLGVDESLYYCLNDFPLSLTLDSGLIGNPNDFTFSWTNGATTPTTQINTIGTHAVTVTSSAGCQSTRTFNVEASNIATIKQPILIKDGNSPLNVVEITVSGEGIYEYALENQEGELIGFQENGIFNSIPSGLYTALVKDTKNNCGIAQQEISVIGFPQYFTPNGDGVHEFWKIDGVNKNFQPKSDIYIFDRYGKLLAQIDPLGPGWDGTFNGKKMPTNDYWFKVELQDGRVYKNNFTLKR